MTDQAKVNFDGKTCEEASIFSREKYIPCGKPAMALVKNRDPKPYFMCEGCADHNVRNRGAHIVAVKPGMEEAFGDLTKRNLPTE